MMVDSHGRKINYLRVSVTDRCNFRCVYCMPENGISNKEHRNILRNEEITEIVKSAVGLGISKIRITGGEPLVRKGIVQLVHEIAHLEGVEEVVMTTNGMLLPKYIKELKSAGLKRVNISLDTLKEDKFKEITRNGDLKKVLKGIDMALELGMKPVKINAVLIGGYNDDEIEALVNLTKDRPIDVRFIELMPIGEARDWAKERFVSNALILERVPELLPIQIDDVSSPATYYKLPEAKGKVGLISPISCQFCDNCNRIRLTADGKMKPCLHSEVEIDLLDIVRCYPEQLESEIEKTILGKPLSHLLENDEVVVKSRNMNQIGG